MSTKGLIETCINYPLLDVTFIDNTNFVNDLKKYKENFYGLRMLDEREDAVEVILQMYRDLDFNTFSRDDPRMLVTFLYFNEIITQTSIIKIMSEEAANELIGMIFEAADKIDAKYGDIVPSYLFTIMAIDIIAQR